MNNCTAVSTHEILIAEVIFDPVADAELAVL